ncbi:hypothetical protein [Methylocystis sp. JR02]|uniref:hypothetical protein n=1 Tax=Methylocystis sp. JR02 TaxID=3046284 RepID=UPI0024BB5838|nr:hypothetical protein [Methylocystis sp. JR02]MDJ0447987.1 hypothetical protein [Methylocystis sp. JR02]
MMEVWGKFVVCVSLIAVAGPSLSRYGDVIAQKTGLSRGWIGLLLLATATSLPELFTGVSAVGQIIRETYTASPLFDVVFVAVSLKGLHAVAALIDRRKAAQFAVA